MTNERAIELLNRISDSQFDGPHGDERREALEMAVRALFSQQTVNDSQGLVNDCISRKMAIDAVDVKCLHRGIVKGIQGIIEDLPSAQPERKTGKWMSVSDETRTWYHCSKCHYQQYEKTKFCPSCGARMESESE